MNSSVDSPTSASLLARLRDAPRDEVAWRQFIERYGGRIYGWCRHWNLQEADAQDVTQIVLLKLADKMQAFTYDPARSFRGWLRTVAHHAWSDFLGDRHRAGVGSGDTDVRRRLEAVEARDDLLRHLDEEFDRELLEHAMTRVRLRVQPHTWEAFRLLAVEGVSGADVARKLGLKVATVFVARSKVHKLLQEEIRRLEPSGPTASEESS